MNDPCTKSDMITLIHDLAKDTNDDVKKLLAHHHQMVGKRKFINKLLKISLGILTALSGIIYGARH